MKSDVSLRNKGLQPLVRFELWSFMIELETRLLPTDQSVLEDLHDLAVIAERRNGDFVGLNELRTSLAEDTDSSTAGCR